MTARAALALALATGCAASPAAPTPPTVADAPPTSATTPAPTTTAAPAATAPPPSSPTSGVGRAVPAGGTTAPEGNTPEPPPGDDVWARLALCESGMRPGLRNPPYSGAFQFTAPTWRSVGETGEAADYSYEHQRAAAIRLQARSGWGQWPACSRKLGLR